MWRRRQRSHRSSFIAIRFVRCPGSASSAAIAVREKDGCWKKSPCIVRTGAERRNFHHSTTTACGRRAEGLTAAVEWTLDDPTCQPTKVLWRGRRARRSVSSIPHARSGRMTSEAKVIDGRWRSVSEGSVLSSCHCTGAAPEAGRATETGERRTKQLADRQERPLSLLLSVQVEVEECSSEWMVVEGVEEWGRRGGGSRNRSWEGSGRVETEEIEGDWTVLQLLVWPVRVTWK